MNTIKGELAERSNQLCMKVGALPSSALRTEIANELANITQRIAELETLIGKAAEAMGVMRFWAGPLGLTGKAWSEEPGFGAKVNSAFFKFKEKSDGLATLLAEVDFRHLCECELSPRVSEAIARAKNLENLLQADKDLDAAQKDMREWLGHYNVTDITPKEHGEEWLETAKHKQDAIENRKKIREEALKALNQ